MHKMLGMKLALEEEKIFVIVSYTILQNITSEICALHLTHPSAHPEQWAANAAAPGEHWGFGALLKGLPSVGYWRWRERSIHSPHWQFLPEPRFEPTNSGYKSLIRPRLPPLIKIVP